MESSPEEEEELLSDLKISETDEERDIMDIASEPTASTAEIRPVRRRCRIVRTTTTETAVTEETEGLRKMENGRTLKFVPRPAVPTPSKAELLRKQAEDISIRGNPCISILKAQNRLLVRINAIFTSFLIFFLLLTLVFQSRTIHFVGYILRIMIRLKLNLGLKYRYTGTFRVFVYFIFFVGPISSFLSRLISV